MARRRVEIGMRRSRFVFVFVFDFGRKISAFGAHVTCAPSSIRIPSTCDHCSDWISPDHIPRALDDGAEMRTAGTQEPFRFAVLQASSPRGLSRELDDGLSGTDERRAFDVAGNEGPVEGGAERSQVAVRTGRAGAVGVASSAELLDRVGDDVSNSPFAELHAADRRWREWELALAREHYRLTPGMPFVRQVPRRERRPRKARSRARRALVS